MGTDNSSSPAQQPPQINAALSNMSIASLVIYCVIFLVGTVGNGLVIYVTGFKMKRTVNSVWFLNLALADFLFTGFLIISIIHISQQDWKFGLILCKLNSYVAVVNMFTSIFLLTAISLDRCLSIWVVVWAQNKRTVRKTQLICLAIWIISMACSFPYAFYREIKTNKGVTRCSYSTTPAQFESLSIFRFVVGFLIPFLVITVSYVAISVRAARLQKSKKKRPRRMIFSIVLAFFICWLPFHIFCLIELYGKSIPNRSSILRTVGPLALSLGFMNSCLNPILYVFMCDEFQKKLKQSICFVLESALAEDHLSFMSSRSLSSHFSRITRKSDSTAPVEMKGIYTSANSTTESNTVVTVERETWSND